ncbi:FecR/PupR family sigma factor regulator [Methylocella silvestris]|nr:DUF4880 domain-containing protein [Methylocella silvestris]
MDISFAPGATLARHDGQGDEVPSQDEKAPNDRQRDAAALWLARCAGGSLGESQKAKLALWMQADPRHRTALREAIQLWNELERPALALAARAKRPPLDLRREGRLWLGFGAAAAGFVVLLALWLKDGGAPVQPNGAREGKSLSRTGWIRDH